MTRRSKVRLAGLVAAVLFTLANAGGGVYAAMQGELPHTGLHVVLGLLGAYAASRLAAGRDAGRMGGAGEAKIPATPRELTDRLTQLEQAVDAVAIEVERIGEGQRFMTRLFTERSTARAAAEGAGEPVGSEAQEAAARLRRG